MSARRPSAPRARLLAPRLLERNVETGPAGDSKAQRAFISRDAVVSLGPPAQCPVLLNNCKPTPKLKELYSEPP